MKIINLPENTTELPKGVIRVSADSEAYRMGIRFYQV